MAFCYLPCRIYSRYRNSLDPYPVTLQTLLFREKKKDPPKKVRIFLSARPLKCLRKKGKTPQKSRKSPPPKKKLEKKILGKEGKTSKNKLTRFILVFELRPCPPAREGFSGLRLQKNRGKLHPLRPKNTTPQDAYAPKLGCKIKIPNFWGGVNLQKSLARHSQRKTLQSWRPGRGVLIKGAQGTLPY